MIGKVQRSLLVIPIILLSCSKPLLDKSDLDYLNSLIEADSIEIFERNGDTHINIYEAEHEKIKDMFDSSPIIAHTVHVSMNKKRSSFDNKSFCVVEFFSGDKIVANYRIRNEDLAKAGNMIRSFNDMINNIIDPDDGDKGDSDSIKYELKNRLKSDLSINESTPIYVNNFEVNPTELRLYVQVGENENLKSYMFYYHPRFIDLIDYAEIEE